MTTIRTPHHAPLCNMSHHHQLERFPFPLFEQNSQAFTSTAAQEKFPAKFPGDQLGKFLEKE